MKFKTMLSGSAILAAGLLVGLSGIARSSENGSQPAKLPQTLPQTLEEKAALLDGVIRSIGLGHPNATLEKNARLSVSDPSELATGNEVLYYDQLLQDIGTFNTQDLKPTYSGRVDFAVLSFAAFDGRTGQFVQDLNQIDPSEFRYIFDHDGAISYLYDKDPSELHPPYDPKNVTEFFTAGTYGYRNLAEPGKLFNTFDYPDGRFAYGSSGFMSYRSSLFGLKLRAEELGLDIREIPLFVVAFKKKLDPKADLFDRVPLAYEKTSIGELMTAGGAKAFHLKDSKDSNFTRATVGLFIARDNWWKTHIQEEQDYPGVRKYEARNSQK